MKHPSRRHIVHFGLTMVILVVAATGAAILGGTTQVVSTESTSHSNDPSLAVDGAGHVHVAWYEWTDYGGSGTDSDIFYKVRNATTGTWGTTQVVSTESTGESYSPSLAVDAAGNVHVAWEDNTGLDGLGGAWKIYYKARNATTGTWGTTQVVSTESTGESYSPSLAVDAAGNVHVAWAYYSMWGGSGPDRGIFYKVRDATTGAWGTTQVVSTESTGDSWYPSLAVDGNGHVHVAWSDNTGLDGLGGAWNIYYKARNATTGTWGTTQVVSTESTGGSGSPSLAVDGAGHVHVAWSDTTNYGVSGWDSDIFYKVRDATTGTWGTTQVVSTERPGGSYSPSLAVDAAGNVHVAWSDTTIYGVSGWDSDIFYKVRDATTGTWGTTQVVSTESTGGSGSPSLAVDGAGNVHVAWSDTTIYGVSGWDSDIFYTQNVHRGGAMIALFAGIVGAGVLVASSAGAAARKKTKEQVQEPSSKGTRRVAIMLVVIYFILVLSIVVFFHPIITVAGIIGTLWLSGVVAGIIKIKKKQKNVKSGVEFQLDDGPKRSHADSFTGLLGSAQDASREGNQEFSRGNFTAAMVSWERGLVFYGKAASMASTGSEKARVAENITNLQINIVNAKVMEAQSLGKKASAAHQGARFEDARDLVKQAMAMNESALAYMRDHDGITFPVDTTMIAEKNRRHEVFMQQLDIEEACHDADEKVGEAEGLAKNDDTVSAASIALTNAMDTYNQARRKAGAVPEFHELELAIHEKIARARAVQARIQDHMDALLGIVPTTQVIIDDHEPGAPFSTLKPAGGPVAGKALRVVREYEALGGQIRFKVGLVNETGEVLTDLAISFTLPPALKWVVHEPSKYTRKGDTVVLPKLPVGSKESVSLYLEPVNCMDSPVHAAITFFDARGRQQSVTMEPKQVSITCPVFFTREDANPARVKSLTRRLRHVDTKILPVLDDDRLDVIFTSVASIIGRHDVKLVSQDYDADERFGEAMFFGITKVKKNPMVISLAVNGATRTIELAVSGDDQEAITGLLAELEGSIRQDFLTCHIIETSDAFFDVKTSVLLGQCPYCCGVVDPESVARFKAGEPVTCPHCDTTITTG